MKKKLHFLFLFTLRLMLSLSLLTPMIMPQTHAEETVEIHAEYKYLDGVFNEKTLQESYKIAEQITKIYPSRKYHYIFVGRSLSLIKAILEVQGVMLTSLPLRGKQIDLTFSSEAGRQNQPLIWEHLRAHLPTERDLAGKKLVLLDFTKSGAGLQTAHKLVSWYYGNTRKIHTLEVTNYFIGYKNLLPGSRERVIRISSESMTYMHLLNSNFDRYAGHGTFNIETAQYLFYDYSLAESYRVLKSWLRNKKTQKSSLRGFCRGYLI